MAPEDFRMQGTQSPANVDPPPDPPPIPTTVKLASGRWASGQQGRDALSRVAT